MVARPSSRVVSVKMRAARAESPLSAALPKARPGLHEIAAQGGEVGQALHARENVPGAPFACLDGAGQGVRPSGTDPGLESWRRIAACE